MQSTGDVFNPDYYLIDTKSNLVFRKEQFFNDGRLSTEYVIRDKRYYDTEILRLMTRAGFTVLSTTFVQAGRWNIPLKSDDLSAKEILLVIKKDTN
jgi:hypothetical protein